MFTVSGGLFNELGAMRASRPELSAFSRPGTDWLYADWGRPDCTPGSSTRRRSRPGTKDHQHNYSELQGRVLRNSELLNL